MLLCSLIILAELNPRMWHHTCLYSNPAPVYLDSATYSHILMFNPLNLSSLGSPLRVKVQLVYNLAEFDLETEAVLHHPPVGAALLVVLTAAVVFPSLLHRDNCYNFQD